MTSERLYYHWHGVPGRTGWCRLMPSIEGPGAHVMYDDKVAVFLSCSHTFKEKVAYRFREVLEAPGIDMIGIIVEDIPKLGAAWTADDKVEGWLDVSDAFVALMTQDGTVTTRQNIVDEMARARYKGNIGGRVMIIRDERVQIPSNIAPIWCSLDVANPNKAISDLLKQLRTWGYTMSDHLVLGTANEPVSQPPSVLADVKPGDDYVKTKVKVLRWMADNSKENQHSAILHLLQEMDSEDWNVSAAASSIVEYLVEADPTLISQTELYRLATSRKTSIRMSAAVILWGWSMNIPGYVPIDLLMRLIRSDEDWYVFTPARSAMKQLALSRVDAMAVIRQMALDDDHYDQEFALDALEQISSERPDLVPADAVVHFTSSEDESIMERAKAILYKLPRERTGEDWRFKYAKFSSF